ncbi:hypothetical protein LEP1GSC188_4481 [Leptospira weilii serovar Topaz str. LT2116]|uniref:Uncharacterized protein n=1 Tax=Leptospira weilii serovar Topaz str. LT2116 TaxID=1088540 RepID=M3GXE2_9LEPT|nr:hypothetical protein LEP1GSC188_4481 [Leptospira weilii serovar Topaz str. LT2116]
MENTRTQAATVRTLKNAMELMKEMRRFNFLVFRNDFENSSFEIDRNHFKKK